MKRIVSRRIKGVSLIEVLIGIVIVTIASIATLQYFAYAKGGIGRQGNRRAALERARQRLEQLLSVSITSLPPRDGQVHWCASGDPCVQWTTAAAAQTIAVNNLPNQRLETTAQWLDEPDAGTAGLDVVDVGVKVWFVPGTVDDNFHRVYLRSLRAP